MTPLIITPSDLRPAAVANRLHELHRMRRPDRPSLARHLIVWGKYGPDDDGFPPPAAPAVAIRRAA